MAKILRQKNTKDEGTANIPEGVREMLFTVGQQETDLFQNQNDHLRDKGTCHKNFKIAFISVLFQMHAFCVRSTFLCANGPRFGQWAIRLDAEFLRLFRFPHTHTSIPQWPPQVVIMRNTSIDGISKSTKMQRHVYLSSFFLFTFDNWFFFPLFSEHFKDPNIMIKEKFRLISHPQTKLQFWVKCDKKKSKGRYFTWFENNWHAHCIFKFVTELF